MDLSSTGGGLDWVLGENFFTESVFRHWNRLPGEGGVPILRGIQEMCGCGG